MSERHNSNKKSNPASLSQPAETPAVGIGASLTERVPDDWDALREAALSPRLGTDAPASPEGRLELLRGAELLRMHGPKAIVMDRRTGARRSLAGHQILMSDILDLDHQVSAIREPRRSFKTSTLFAKAMGRIATLEEYRVAYSMTTYAIKARQRFRDDIVKALEFLYPDPKDRPFNIVKAGGSERIEWYETGSVFAFLAPKGDAFRSDAWDWIILDEAGEASPEMGADVLDGAAATLDTTHGPLTVAGTAPKYREGNLLWDALAKAEAGAKGYVQLDYSARQDLRIKDVESWDQAADETLAIHPNIGITTDLDWLETRYNLIGAHSYLREYLGVAEKVGADAFLNIENWASGGSDGALPTIPDHHRIAVATNIAGTSAAFVAAWRDDEGKACILTIEHRAGTNWVPNHGMTLYRKYRSPFVYDNNPSYTKSVIDRMRRMRNPTIKFEEQNWASVASSAALIKEEIDGGNVRHWNQPILTAAVEGAGMRQPHGTSRWSYEPVGEVDIVCLEAAMIALRAYDQTPAPRKSLGVISA